jgi:hypothetical protein
MLRSEVSPLSAPPGTLNVMQGILQETDPPTVVSLLETVGLEIMEDARPPSTSFSLSGWFRT